MIHQFHNSPFSAAGIILELEFYNSNIPSTLFTIYSPERKIDKYLCTMINIAEAAKYFNSVSSRMYHNKLVQK